MKALCLFTFLLYSQFYFAQIPTDGLISYFSLNGNAVDDQNYQDGITVGNVGPTEDRSGNPGCAMSFDGSQSSMIFWQNFQDYSIHPDSSLSISLWYKGGSQDVGDYEVLFLKYGIGLNPVAQPSYGLALYDLNKIIMHSNNNTLWLTDSIIPVPDPNWHHLVGVFEVGHWKMYLDNTLIVEQIDSLAHVHDFPSDLVMGFGFEGSIDDCAFYNRVLSASEVNDIYNTPSSCVLNSTSKELEIDVNIYPNPTDQTLRIELSRVNTSTIRIFNDEGKLIKTLQVHTDVLEVDVSAFPIGLYVISFEFEDQIFGHKKFVVK